jgi:NAD(P)-dependent dehydrogenase (short-subunit alcohol dehydrogenase family)
MSATATRIALITGANKGIGFEVARQLVSHGFQVVLGARRRDAGRQAAAELAQNGGFDKLTTGGQTQFLEIDIANPASITRAAKQLAALVDHLDVLVNNAGILEDGKATAPDVDAGVVRRTFETNTLGPLLVTQAMLPLLLQAPAYSISKTALNAVTRQFAAALRPRHIAVNSVCPGWVRTAMGGAGAPRAVQQGADTIVWLATEAPASLTGRFVRDRKVIGW